MNPVRPYGDNGAAKKNQGFVLRRQGIYKWLKGGLTG